MREADAAAMLMPRRPARLAVWATLAFAGAALWWANFATLDVVVVGEGKVIPSSQVQVVQNLEGGIVAEIPVRIGDRVEQGQVLMRLDATRFDASFKEGRAKDDALLAKIVRLRAEATGAAFAAAPALLKASPKLVAEERSLFESRQRELQAVIGVMNRQLDQRRQELNEKASREKQLRDSLGLVEKELAMTRPLLQQGVVSEVEVLRLERNANDLKGDLDATRLSVPRLEAAIGEIQQRISEATARFRADAMRELNAAQAEQSAISAANTGLRDRVERTVVTAPLSGTIKQIKVNTIGGVVQPGMDLIEIVPAEDTLLIEARVSPADIAFLRPGQEAMVKISAYDFSIFGGFPATLEYISADSLQPERTNEKPESYFRVRARTHSKKSSRSDTELPILPGMIATIDIKTDQRTVLQYLLKPIVKAKETAMRER